MIDEIEREISTLNIHECDIEDIFEILDKYNNSKPKSITQLTKEQLEDLCLNLMHTDKIKTNYVRAFEELFNFYENDLKGMQSKNDVMVLGRLKDLKKKYNLGGE